MGITRTVSVALATASTLGFVLAAAPCGMAAASEDAASAASRDVSPRNVSRWVAAAQKVGAAEEARQVHFSMFLGFKNTDQLKQLIEEQYKPGSAQYQKFLTPAQFRARFAPDAAKVKLVEDTLRKMGFTLEYTPKSGLFVQAAGTVAQVKAAFGVSQDLYSYKGNTLRANRETPRLPAKLQGIVTFVAGLDDTSQLRRSHRVNAHHDDLDAIQSARIAAAKQRTASVERNAPPPVQDGILSKFCSTYYGDHKARLGTAPSVYPQTLPWELCSYTPQQLRQAYGSNKVTQTGKGVRVGIVDVYASPTIVDDANRYSKNHGLPQLTYLNFQQMVPPGLFNVKANDPCGPQGWYEEETLDVEAVHSMAPGAFILYGGITCTDPGNAALYNFIDNHLVDIVTNSYGFNGEALPAEFIDQENQFFMQAAAQGMSIVFSSGDDGDVAAANGIASGSWEATSPYVTGVGGTSLALRNARGVKQEWGWGSYRAFLGNARVAANGGSIVTSGAELPFAFYGGAGGGPSLSQLAQSYQAKVPYSLSGFTTLKNGAKVPLQTPHRVTPDIAMVADPYTGFLTGETYTKAGDPTFDGFCKSLSSTTEYCEIGIGGTSLAAPAFAGVLALVNQARFAKGKPAIGFVNPALYRLPIGAPGSTSAPIVDVRPPTQPAAVLRGYSNDQTEVRVVTMNSVPNAAGTAAIEGANTSYRTTAGYDEVTGLGTPYVPALINALVAK
jgi:subtilase family serine protease